MTIVTSPTASAASAPIFGKSSEMAQKGRETGGRGCNGRGMAPDECERGEGGRWGRGAGRI